MSNTLYAMNTMYLKTYTLLSVYIFHYVVHIILYIYTVNYRFRMYTHNYTIIIIYHLIQLSPPTNYSLTLYPVLTGQCHKIGNKILFV